MRGVLWPGNMIDLGNRDFDLFEKVGNQHALIRQMNSLQAAKHPECEGATKNRQENNKRIETSKG